MKKDDDFPWTLWVVCLGVAGHPNIGADKVDNAVVIPTPMTPYMNFQLV